VAACIRFTPTGSSLPAGVVLEERDGDMRALGEGRALGGGRRPTFAFWLRGLERDSGAVGQLMASSCLGFSNTTSRSRRNAHQLSPFARRLTPLGVICSFVIVELALPVPRALRAEGCEYVCRSESSFGLGDPI
jgi:hypothetical protein